MPPRSPALFTMNLALLLATAVCAEQAAVTIDGLFDDWQTVPVLHTDTAGDAGVSGVDLGRLWVADDDRFLFLRFEVGVEIDINEFSDVRLFIDTDLNAGTGFAIGGIGADLEWEFGTRRGVFHVGGFPCFIRFHDIRLRTGPEVSDTVFECAIGRDSLPDGVTPLFPGPAMQLVMRDGATGDLMPDAGALGYTFDQGIPIALPPPIPLAKDLPGDVRLVSWNVEMDSLWDPAEAALFGRQLVAVDPDIIVFQEIATHSAAETVAYVETWLPSGPGEMWYGAGFVDTKTVSRYPILFDQGVDNHRATLLDTTAALGSQLLVVNVHFPCCDMDPERQMEIDEVLAFIRDAKAAGGALTLAPDTPIVVAGDTNLVRLRAVKDSLMNGDIADEGTWGMDFTPDWDGSSFVQLISRQTEKRMAYTRIRNSGSISPGFLDYVIYTESVLDIGNHFVLHTREMSAAALAAAGLLATDADASDHLLVCADLRPELCAPPPGVLCGDCDDSGQIDILDGLRGARIGVGLIVPTSPDYDRCDVTGNGQIDTLDVLRIAQISAGLPVTLTCCAGGAPPPGVSCGDVTINEVDTDTPGFDVDEFIELHNPTGGLVDLAAGGYVLVFVNGSDDRSYEAFDVIGTIDPGAYHVLGNAAVPNIDQVFPDGALQNGPDGVALYSGIGCSAASFPNDTVPTPPPAGCTLVDAVVYDTADPDDAGLLAALGQGEQIDEGTFGMSSQHSIQRAPDSEGCPGGIAGNWKVALPTPGAPNGP